VAHPDHAGSSTGKKSFLALHAAAYHWLLGNASMSKVLEAHAEGERDRERERERGGERPTKGDAEKTERARETD